MEAAKSASSNRVWPVAKTWVTSVGERLPWQEVAGSIPAAGLLDRRSLYLNRWFPGRFLFLVGGEDEGYF
jgi:hypothetical protein